MEQTQTNENQIQGVEVNANFDAKIEKVVTKFSFRTVKTKDETTGLEAETKRPTVELELPVITVQGVVAALQAGGKQLDLVIEACRQYQYDRARELVNENEQISATNFPYDELSWEKIANLPKAERRGGGIDKETWEAFGKDYVAVMPAATGKTEEQVINASKILLNKFQAVKNSKPHLKLLKDQLSIYMTASANAEQFTDCIAFLIGKADKFLAMDEADLLANL